MIRDEGGGVFWGNWMDELLHLHGQRGLHCLAYRKVSHQA